MSQTQQQSQQTTNVPAQQPEKEQVKKPTGYRVEKQKRIQINRSHVNRRQRAEVLKQLSIGLFGRRRYRNMYLLSSLNNFYYALMIANTLQKRVQRVALVISMDKVNFTEYADEGAQGVEKQYSTFSIKITRQPTEEDRKHSGFNEGNDKIQNPLTEIIKLRTQRRGGDRRRGLQRRYQQRRDNNKRLDREPRRRDNRETEGRQSKRQHKKYEQKGENYPGRRRQEGQRRQNRYYEQNRENRDYRPTQDRRGNNYSYDRYREDRRQTQRKYREEQDFDRRPRRTRENKQQRIQDDNGQRRGEKKTRGGQRTQQGGRVAGHEYDKGHLNRQNNERQQRGYRAPPRKNNRYSSDEQN